MLYAARGCVNKHILVPLSVILLDIYYKRNSGKEKKITVLFLGKVVKGK